MMKYEMTEFGKSCRNIMVVCGLFFVAAVTIALRLPSKIVAKPSPAELEKVIAKSDDCDFVSPDFGKIVEDGGFYSAGAGEDTALSLYRHPSSRSAVEWFYLHVTGSRETAIPILEEADKNDIPLSLAFALAYTESRYKANAINRNRNASIDRGLFQLNNKSFPQLKEEEFFNPKVSAKYGMSHLKFCIGSAGNEISGLAMYNAGTTKVRQNLTPQSTLNYVGKIMSYRERLDRLFAEEVLPYYDTTRQFSGVSVAYLSGRRSEK